MVECPRRITSSVPEGVDAVQGSVATSRESSTRKTEVLEMDDCARGVAVLFSPRSSDNPCPGLRELFAICKESASEDEAERESVGSRSPGTETDVLPDTTSHSPSRVTTDQMLQGLGRGSWDPLMTSRLLEQGRVHRELATLKTFFSGHQSMDHKNALSWLWQGV